MGENTGLNLKEWPDTVSPHMVDQLLDIIAEKAKLDRAALTPDATLESLNIPSLDMVDILFGVEEEFNIYVPMGDELSHVVYLRDLVEVLAGQAEQGAAADNAVGIGQAEQGAASGNAAG